MKPGDIIGPYELIRQLGAGAFGEVWLAKHLDLGEQWALKIPTDPHFVKQLRQEGQVQYRLHHPNIVETRDLNTRHDPPYFAMAYVEGRNLRSVLQARGKLPVEEALGIVRQVLLALNHAHEHKATQERGHL